MEKSLHYRLVRGIALFYLAVVIFILSTASRSFLSVILEKTHELRWTSLVYMIAWVILLPGSIGLLFLKKWGHFLTLFGMGIWILGNIFFLYTISPNVFVIKYLTYQYLFSFNTALLIFCFSYLVYIRKYIMMK